MKKFCLLVLAVLSLANAAQAAGTTRTTDKKPSIGTNRAAMCSTPSSKITKECAHMASAQPSHHPYPPTH